MIYLASPYTDVQTAVMQERFVQTQKYVAEQLRQGSVVFSPIIYCHQFVTHNFGHTAADWIDFNLTMLSKADMLHVLLLPGWQASVGVKIEIAVARSHGLFIKYVDPLDA